MSIFSALSGFYGSAYEAAFDMIKRDTKPTKQGKSKGGNGDGRFTRRLKGIHAKQNLLNHYKDTAFDYLPKKAQKVIKKDYSYSKFK